MSIFRAQTPIPRPAAKSWRGQQLVEGYFWSTRDKHTGRSLGISATNTQAHAGQLRKRLWKGRGGKDAAIIGDGQGAVVQTIWKASRVLKVLPSCAWATAQWQRRLTSATGVANARVGDVHPSSASRTCMAQSAAERSEKV